VTEAIADIDELMAVSKAIIGAPHWEEDGAVTRLVAALSVDGLVTGGLRIAMSATLLTTPQRGDTVLIFQNRPIARLAFRPKAAHVNPGGHPIPPDLRFKSLPPDQSRLYRWEDNRRWPRGANDVLAGRPLDSEPPSLKAAVDIFLAYCHIDADIADAPWRPELGL
jgi:hypothetical protein